MTTRRDTLKGLSGLALCLATGQAPAVIRSRDVTLRVLGTHVTLHEALRRQAEADLGFRIEFTPGGSAQVLQRAATRPESFDIYEQWSNSIKVLWSTGAIQAIDTQRIERWNEINDLSKTGRLTPDASIGYGDAPYRILHVQADDSLGPTPSSRASFLPYVHNVDSFGYRTDVIPAGEPYETESWAWLLDEANAGGVGLVNEPTIGIFDAALAAQSAGYVEFADIGNMTAAEVDRLFEVLIEFKQRGHFSGMWNSVPESVDYMQSGRCHIASMFSPGIASLHSQRVPVLYAAPKEGYRAWHGVMCMSSACHDAQQEAAYAFMNWWLSGWAGAFIAKQGYYISNPERSREFLTEAEWDYWYLGKPAEEALTDTAGQPFLPPGAVRRGGSYERRFSNVAVWNTVMPSYEYSLPRWHEFLLS